MAERATDFARRIGGELSGFASSKTRELTNRVIEGADRVVSAAEEGAYQTALSVVAKRHNLTMNEAESRLRVAERKQSKKR
ncbi:MAG: hypothetical protein Q7S43_05130 [bacterium]|nr:hypothetical protein [bacterium]